jgi:hypothetical protein
MVGSLDRIYSSLRRQLARTPMALPRLFVLMRVTLDFVISAINRDACAKLARRPQVPRRMQARAKRAIS